ncbi:MAG: DUF885 domain-containing protein [Propionibacteriaceae bacterium]|nr:DUF885 domain-containing protein [Propionibacteriaceae bacterium]
MSISSDTAVPRPSTALDAVADAILMEQARLSPTFATGAGIAGFETELDDYSPAGAEASAASARDAIAKIAATEAIDEVDRVTVAAMTERLGLSLEEYEAGDHLRDLNNIASPLQGIRDTFDLMATATTEDWETIDERLAKVPAALAGYRASLAEGLSRGLIPARRQVGIGVEQANDLSRPGSFFDSFTASARPDGSPLPEALRDDLAAHAEAARQAYGDLAAFLADDLAPAAPEADGVGRERYDRASRSFLGAVVDFEETYAWGLDELDRIVAEQKAVAAEIAGPGATIAEAVAQLDSEDRWFLEGADALAAWMTETSQEAISFLDGRHFDIDPRLHRLECLIAPTHSGAIYYTGPSEDLSRPGRMWWSVPESVTRFATWRERTTVYHEGVPGHHLQIGQSVIEPTLNRWRRLGCWVSGHGEGWALYSERLMDEFGFLATPADRLGMLDGQLLRACRVVIDLGVHLALPCPDRFGGGVWDEPKAWNLLVTHIADDEAFLRFELDRYLGWPGQAPSYKIGQRLWEQARADARQRAVARGEVFDLKAFHSDALTLGPLGLDVFAQALAGQFA